jgi:hypothetical protein
MVARWLCLGLVVATLPACCSAACRDENLPEYKDRASPKRTVKLLQYALENGCDRLAYECFTEADRERIGYWKFKWLFCSFDFPGTETSICDLIKEYEVRDERIYVETGRVFGLWKDTLLFVEVKEESGEWKIDGEETIIANGF